MADLSYTASLLKSIIRIIKNRKELRLGLIFMQNNREVVYLPDLTFQGAIEGFYAVEKRRLADLKALKS